MGGWATFNIAFADIKGIAQVKTQPTLAHVTSVD